VGGLTLSSTTVVVAKVVEELAWAVSSVVWVAHAASATVAATSHTYLSLHNFMSLKAGPCISYDKESGGLRTPA
jgi:hypothetical protein